MGDLFEAMHECWRNQIAKKYDLYDCPDFILRKKGELIRKCVISNAFIDEMCFQKKVGIQNNGF